MNQSYISILFSDTWLPSRNGVVTSLNELCRGLVDAGVRVILVVPDGPRRFHGEPRPEMPPDMPPDMSIFSMPSIPLSRDGEIRFSVVSPWRRRKISRIISALSLDHHIVIHSHTEFSLGWTARGLAAELGLPWVHSSHTLWNAYRHYLFSGFRRVPLDSMMRYFLRGCHSCISPSSRGQSWLADLVPDNCDLHIVPNGIDVDVFGFKQSRQPDSAVDRVCEDLWLASNIPAGAQVLLYAGRIAPEKRVIELCHALAPLLAARNQQTRNLQTQGTGDDKGGFRERDAETHEVDEAVGDVPSIVKQPLRLVIVGGGPAFLALHRAVRQLGIADWIVCTGWLPREKLLPWYAAADIFCSLSRSEIHPLTLIEAAAAGLPVAVLDDPAMRSIVVPGRTGILVPEESAYAIAVAELLDNPESRWEMSRNAVAHAQIFSRRQHTQTMLDLYITLF